jgi:tripartite-type tricarboxylate transporter receptor subunit TctC
MSDRRRSRLAFLCIAFGGLAGAVPGHAETVEDFYRGKTVNIVVASGPGGTFPLYAQMLAQYMGRHLPGQPGMVVQHMPGAGGNVAANYMANAAPKDGTVISAVLSPSLTSALLQSVRYDPTKFYWLGSIAPLRIVVVVWDAAPARSLEAAKQTETIVGATGKSNETSMTPLLMNAMLGTRFKVVQGYTGGGELDLAMQRGETHGRVMSWESLNANPEVLKHAVPIAQYAGSIPELPRVPRLVDLVTTDDDRRMVELMELAGTIGRGYYAPPGVPAERAAALRHAFVATLSDADFRSDCAKRGLVVDPVAATDIEAALGRAYATPKPTLDRFKRLSGFE